MNPVKQNLRKLKSAYPAGGSNFIRFAFFKRVQTSVVILSWNKVRNCIHDKILIDELTKEGIL